MKQLITDTMLMPAYAARFACIGGDCEDTCCAGWAVALDKASFDRYQTSLDTELGPLFARHVKRNPGSRSSEDYGHIELQADECQSCALLNEQRLCRIYERLGETALSDTCTYYPRTIHRFGALHQMTLTLSCPEAARLALLHPDAFELVAQEQSVTPGYLGVVKARFGLSLEAMEEVRTLFFQVLMSQDISLANRLKVIGHFCERLDEWTVSKKIDLLPGLLRALEQDLDSGAAMAPFVGQVELPDVQAQVTASFLLVGRESFQSPHVSRVLDEVIQGLGFEAQRPPNGPVLVAAYEDGLRKLAPALEAVPWLLEHYLYNEALREIFPWSQESPRRHYAILVLRFAIIRLMLAGRAAGRTGQLTPAELAETVQVGCRRYVHDMNFTRQAGQALAESDWLSFERLQALL
jgi:lysine-N-methylase